MRSGSNIAHSDLVASQEIRASDSLRGLHRARHFVSDSFRKASSTYRRTSHKRRTSAVTPGFLFSAEGQETTATMIGLSQLTPAVGMRTVTSTAAYQPKAFVHPLQTIKSSGSTPSILLVPPPTAGRRSYQIHEGKTASDTLSESFRKSVRYSHPTATAIISPSSDVEPTQEFHPSMDVNDSAPSSRLGTPMTIDLSNEFPGTVNVKQIARDSSLTLAEAKNMIDGLGVPKHVRKCKSDSSMASSNMSLTNKESQAEIAAHRRDALSALVGEVRSNPANAQSTPECLLPGVAARTSQYIAKPVEKQEHDATSDSLSGPPPLSPPLPAGNSLAYIPYSKLMDRPSTKSGKLSAGNDARHPLKRKSTQSIRHQQVYASVEGLHDFPAFDSVLHDAYATNRRQEVTKSARFSMVDNGFPLFQTDNVPHIEVPRYQRRTLHKEEKEALKEALKEAENATKLSPGYVAKKQQRKSFLARLRITGRK